MLTSNALGVVLSDDVGAIVTDGLMLARSFQATSQPCCQLLHSP